MSRKCLFNNQLKVSPTASLQEECLHRSFLKRGKRGRKIHHGGEKGEIEEGRGRNKVGELNEVEQDLALSQVCTTGGLRRKEFVYTCVCMCLMCVCVRESVCARVCGAAKLATCLSLVVVLVFPFIRPSAAQLPLGAVSLLPCVCVCVCVCVCACVFA